jgi:hypothetical protein
MAGDLERVLLGLKDTSEFAASYCFEVTDEYRALIARVEALPGNQPGADKSGVWPAWRAYVDSFRRARSASR